MHPHEGSLTRDKPPTRFRKQMNQEEWFVDYSLGSEGQCVISRDEFQGPGKTVGNCVSPTRRRVANKRGYVFMSLWKDRNWGHYIFHSSIDYIGNHFCANALKIVCSCRNINLFTVYNFAYKLVRAYAPVRRLLNKPPASLHSEIRLTTKSGLLIAPWSMKISVLWVVTSSRDTAVAVGQRSGKWCSFLRRCVANKSYGAIGGGCPCGKVKIELV